MKVTKESTFQPITITLETQEEVNYLLLLLNLPNTAYEQFKNDTLKYPPGISQYNMWETLVDAVNK